MKKNVIKWILPIVVLFSACKKDDKVATNVTPAPVVTQSNNFGGEFVLSEGGFGANNSKLLYRLDSSTAIANDYFVQQNPTLTGGLGDLANDMIIYGGKIYIVMNGSG